MKNQYFGDKPDYLKYSLIRHLTDNGTLSGAVCWMLTPNTGPPIPSKTSYLLDTHQWRGYDPSIFDYLELQLVRRRIRNVETMEVGGPISYCRFFPEVLRDNRTRREEYLQRFLDFATDCQFVFFDPDTGIQISTVQYGAKHSSRYIYWSEIERVFDRGHSILIFQKIPREPRETYVDRRIRELQQHLSIDNVFGFHDSTTAFLLAAQPDQFAHFDDMCTDIEWAWEDWPMCIHRPV